MRLDDEFEYEDDYGSSSNSSRGDSSFFRKNTYILYSILGAAVIMLLIVAAVFAMNGGFEKKTPSVSAGRTNEEMYSQNDVSQSVDELISGSTLTAQDLDFWHDYDETPEKTEAEKTETTEEEIIDPMQDGKHTKIVYQDGKEEWIDINPYLALNTYNYGNLVYSNGIMKYYDNYVNTSYAGLDLSKYDDYVDFNRVKRAGINFVMLRVGQRGYSTGEITADDNFEDNVKRAAAAGLNIGAYFFSQATTKEEAEEEADYVINTLSGNSITYPVVFYMEDVNSTDVRSDKLNQLQRTNLAIAFMDKVRAAGYIPMIYGNKEYLLKKVSFGSLIGYDVWLSQDLDVPDFPYEFNMWQYEREGKINGVPGNARVSISFVDYSVR